MSSYTNFFGIDVSKDTLDIVQLCDDKQSYCQIKNRKNQILSWIKKLDPCSSHCILEPTGAYSSKIIHYLSIHQIPFSVVDPTRSDGFTKAQGIISKNDHQAALSLATMGKTLDLPLYKYPDSTMLKRKQLLMGINALKKQQQMLKNQIHALEHQIIFEPKVKPALQAALDTVEQQLEQLENELMDSSDEEHQQQLKLLQSVVGIGVKTANLLLVATGGLANFKQAKQLSKFIGLVPYSHFSGSSVRKNGKITKKGNANLRATLYMAARSAVRYNLACKDLYQRLTAAGKPHKKAMVAVMNKLIKQAFGVFNSGVSFDNQLYLKFVKI